MELRTYEVRAVWLNNPASGLLEEFREYEASALAEALTMAERDDAGRPNGPDAYGIQPEDYALARAEGIAFNEADGLLVDAVSDEQVFATIIEQINTTRHPGINALRGYTTRREVEAACGTGASAAITRLLHAGRVKHYYGRQGMHLFTPEAK